MAKQKSLSIIALVGLTGSGKSSAANYLSQSGMPKITSLETTEIISEIANLESAGQRLIVIDDLASWDQFVAIKKAFPGRLSVISLFMPKNIRHKIAPESSFELEQADRKILETSLKAEPIAAADFVIINDGSLESLHKKIDDLVAEIHTCKNGVWC